MENASKALIIAGAILLSILIIALGIYVFNMAKGATNTDQLDGVQKQAFNSQFSQYNGTQNGSSVKDLIDVLLSNNQKNKESSDKLVSICYIETRSGDSNILSAVNNAIGSNTIYTYDYSNASNRVRADGSTYNAKNLANEAGLGSKATGASFFFNFNDSVEYENNLKGTGILRNKIADSHVYKIGYSICPGTGLIDFIFIEY